MPLQTTETPAEAAEKLNESIDPAGVTMIKAGAVWLVKRKAELFKARWPQGYIIKLEGHMDVQDHKGASPTPFEKDVGFMTDLMLKACTTFPRIFVLAGAARDHFIKDMNAFGEPFQLNFGTTKKPFDVVEGLFYIMPIIQGLTTLDGMLKFCEKLNKPQGTVDSFVKSFGGILALKKVSDALEGVMHPAAFNELGRIFAADFFNHNLDRFQVGGGYGADKEVDSWAPVECVNSGNLFVIPQAGSKTGKLTFCGIDFVFPLKEGCASQPITNKWLGYALQEGKKDLLEQVMKEFFKFFKLGVDNIRQIQIVMPAADYDKTTNPENPGSATFVEDAGRQISPKLYDDFRKGVKAGRHAIEKFVKETLKANGPNMPSQLRARAVALGWAK